MKRLHLRQCVALGQATIFDKPSPVQRQSAHERDGWPCYLGASQHPVLPETELLALGSQTCALKRCLPFLCLSSSSRFTVSHDHSSLE